jgi:hypothetical protein
VLSSSTQDGQSHPRLAARSSLSRLKRALPRPCPDARYGRPASVRRRAIGAQPTPASARVTIAPGPRHECWSSSKAIAGVAARRTIAYASQRVDGIAKTRARRRPGLSSRQAPRPSPQRPRRSCASACGCPHRARSLTPSTSTSNERTAGGHGLLGAVPRSYQVTPDIPDRRRATQQRRSGHSGRQPQRESARRPVGTLSTSSDVTDTHDRNSKPRSESGRMALRNTADPPGKADPVTVRESVRARSGRVSGPDEDAALTSRDHRDGG